MLEEYDIECIMEYGIECTMEYDIEWTMEYESKKEKDREITHTDL